jgi:hypothetical protein
MIATGHYCDPVTTVNITTSVITFSTVSTFRHSRLKIAKCFETLLLSKLPPQQPTIAALLVF